LEEFYADWRRRFAVHAALLLTFSAVLGFQYRGVLEYDDPPRCNEVSVKRICDPAIDYENSGAGIGICPYDNPCLPDTILEHRWRSAHQQGLMHALLLFGFAVAAPYLRIGRFVFNAAGWLVLLGVWAAPIGATIMAIGTTYKSPTMMYCAVTGDTLAVTHCMANTIGAVAGISTGIAFIVVALRGIWEAIREFIVPATWRNWARIVKARPRRIEIPGTVDEICDVVKAAIEEKTTVRAYGARYSWSPIAPTDGIMIDMRRLDGIDQPVLITIPDSKRDTRATHTVRVEAGATLRDLALHLMHPDRKLMLQASTVNPWVQVGGALANGCHGTGVDHKSLVDLVTSIEIVQAQYHPVTGVLECVKNTYERPRHDPRPGNYADWRNWRALIVNLGSLGVMHAVTFECVPIYDVRIVDTSYDMRSTIDSDAMLRTIIGHRTTAPFTVENQYSEIFWFPFNEELFVRTWSPGTGTDTSNGDFNLWFWVRQWLVAKLVGPIVFIGLGLFPFLTPFLMRIFHMAFATTDARVRAPNAMQYERFFMRVYDMGYAIGYDPDPARTDGFDDFRKAWCQVVEKLENARHRGEYPQNLVLHIRFGKRSEAYLHPNRGAPFSAYMEVVTHVNAARQLEHFGMIERIWHRIGGKPHWGKVTYQPDHIIENHSAADVANFLAIRRQMDPAQIFLNDYVRQILHV
jgi:FAD/FMN-containing dehydrogenase